MVLLIKQNWIQHVILQLSVTQPVSFPTYSTSILLNHKVAFLLKIVSNKDDALWLEMQQENIGTAPTNNRLHSP